MTSVLILEVESTQIWHLGMDITSIEVSTFQWVLIRGLLLSLVTIKCSDITPHTWH